MIRKDALFRKGICSGLLAAAVFVGAYACASPPPSASSPAPPQDVVTLPTPPPVLETGGKSPTPVPFKAEIRGRKFVDRDGNRQFGTGDTSESGWEIRLYPSSAVTSNKWDTPLASATTDSNGNFAFTNLDKGSYLVAPAATGKNGERLQQVSPTETAQAKCVTLPTQATTACQPIACQVTIDSGYSQPCELSFLDQTLPGMAYPPMAGLGGYPIGWPFPYEVWIDPDCDDDRDNEPTPEPTQTVALRTAATFAILAGSTITSTGSTIVTGDIGLSPGAGIFGFPPGTFTGALHERDAVAAQAKNDLSLAFNDAFGRSGAISVSGGHLSGKTLSPGVYKAENSAFDLAANGTLTLDAGSLGSKAVWIFQAQTNVAAGALSRVILSNGAKASNVFWVVGNSATIGASSIFQGTVMAQQSIAMGSGTNLQGRALAMISSVTLDTNIVTRPAP